MVIVNTINPFLRAKRVVIKIGSNVLADESGLKRGVFARIAKEVRALQDRKIEVAIVSSGAIATAMAVFGRAERPRSIPEKQAFAAVGQPQLMRSYLDAFAKHDLRAAQVLLTHADFVDRVRFLNAKHALQELFDLGVVPIINENDTVSVDEIKFGDNDRLSAFVAGLVSADALIILSHVAGLYDDNPNENPDAQIIPVVKGIDGKIKSLLFSEKNERSIGGMASKLDAAQICGETGIPLVIADGAHLNVVTKILSGEKIGTRFDPSGENRGARKTWIARVLKPKGKIFIDAGAEQALIKKRSSLLPKGIVRAEGKFDNGDCVEICSQSNAVLARGLSSYAWWETEKIMGRRSAEIGQILGYTYGDELVHRDDLVVM